MILQKMKKSRSLWKKAEAETTVNGMIFPLRQGMYAAMGKFKTTLPDQDTCFNEFGINLQNQLKEIK